MLDTFKKALGYMWASPVTLLGLLYVLTFWGMGWYRWHGVRGDGMVWILNSHCPSWLSNLWDGWAGQAVGNVVVLRGPPSASSTVLRHELRHVKQCMILGPIQPIVYAINFVAIKLGCPDSHPYYDNPMEIDARRAAGQVVDVVGAMKRIKEGVEKKK